MLSFRYSCFIINLFVLVCIVLNSCTTTQLMESWKNPEIGIYTPSKVLVVGMTPNIQARKQFEEQLRIMLEERGVETIKSLDLFEPDFTTEEKNEKELKLIEKILLANGFDTILFTKIIGVEDRIAYKKGYSDYDETYRKFKEDYLMYQDVFYNPDYY